MKTCTRFHAEDIERGDRLELIRDSDDPEPFIVEVRNAVRSTRFGWTVQDSEGEYFYLNDFDSVREAGEDV